MPEAQPATRNHSANFLEAQVILQRFRYSNRSVRLLIALDEGDKQPGQGGSRTVERMAKAVLSVYVLVFEVHSTCLEILKIGAAGHFKIAPLPGRPNFDVVGLCCSEAKIAGTEFNNSIMQAEHL